MTATNPPQKDAHPNPHQAVSAMRATTLLQSFGFAWAGLCYLVGTQRNFRIHLAIAVAVLVACWLLRAAAWEWVAVLATIGLVLITEALNTALEAVVDLAVGNTLHPLAKLAKDVAAAACLIAALVSVAVGLVMVMPRLALP